MHGPQDVEEPVAGHDVVGQDLVAVEALPERGQAQPEPGQRQGGHDEGGGGRPERARRSARRDRLASSEGLAV